MKDTCLNGMTDVEDFTATRLSAVWGESASTKIWPRSGRITLARNIYASEILSITKKFNTIYTCET